METARIPPRTQLRNEFDWMEKAACLYQDGLFFSKAKVDRAEAEAICQTCPVFEQCAAWARNVHPSDGMWAGTWRTRSFNSFLHACRYCAEKKEGVRKRGEIGSVCEECYDEIMGCEDQAS